MTAQMFDVATEAERESMSWLGSARTLPNERTLWQRAAESTPVFKAQSAVQASRLIRTIHRIYDQADSHGHGPRAILTPGRWRSGILRAGVRVK